MEARPGDDDGKDDPQGENSADELWLRDPNMMKVWTGIQGVPLLTLTHRDIPPYLAPGVSPTGGEILIDSRGSASRSNHAESWPQAS